LKNWHVYQGFSDPTAHTLIRKTLTGIRHIHGKPKEKAAALTLEHLIKMTEYLSCQSSLTALRNLAMLQIGFFGAFRRSELAAIQWEHIRILEEGMEILVPRSKTDQEGEGQLCAIPYGHETLCPVNAFINWCKAAGIESGYIFRPITRQENILPQA